MLPKLNEMDQDELLKEAIRLKAKHLDGKEQILAEEATYVLRRLPKYELTDKPAWETVALVEEDLLSGPGFSSALSEAAVRRYVLWNPVWAAIAVRNAVLGRSLRPSELGRRALLSSIARPTVAAMDPRPEAPVIAFITGPEIFIVHLEQSKDGGYQNKKAEWLRKKAPQVTTQPK